MRPTVKVVRNPLGDAYRKVSLSGLRHIAPYVTEVN
jgi:hypothetical protein